MGASGVEVSDQREAAIASMMEMAEAMLKPGITRVRLAAFGVEVELEGVVRIEPPKPTRSKRDDESLDQREAREREEAERQYDRVMFPQGGE